MEPTPWPTLEELKQMMYALMGDVAPNEEAFADGLGVNPKTLYNWRKELGDEKRRCRRGTMPPPDQPLQECIAYLRQRVELIRPRPPELPPAPQLPPLPGPAAPPTAQQGEPPAPSPRPSNDPPPPPSAPGVSAPPW